MKRNHYAVRSVMLSAVFLITFGWIANSLAQAQCPVDNRLVKMPASDDKYYLPQNYIFKVKFDAPISTDTYKTGSIVQFSVIENVFGLKLPKFKTEAESMEFRKDIDEIIEAYGKETDEIIKGYGEGIGAISEPVKKDDKAYAKKLKELETDKVEKLEELYARNIKVIEYLFFNIDYPTLGAEIEDKFNLDIKAISDNDPDKKDKIKKLEKDKVKELDQLKNNKIKELEKKIEEKFNSDVLDIKKKFNLDILAISDNDPVKKDEVEKFKIEKLEKLKKDKDEEIKNLSKIPEVVIVIPKTAKGYGKVERAKRQAPLFLNYKARMSVVLDYVLLDNGDCIPVEVAVSPDTRLYIEGDEDFGNVKDCKSGGLTGKKCIKGRRPQYKFVSPIISGMAAIATAFLDNPTAQAIVGVKAAEQLTNGDVGNVINGSDATISDKLIYEVKTIKGRIGTFKKEEKK